MGLVAPSYPQGFVLLIFFYLLKDLIQNLLKLDLNLIDLGNIFLTLLARCNPDFFFCILPFQSCKGELICRKR